MFGNLKVIVFALFSAAGLCRCFPQFDQFEGPFTKCINPNNHAGLCVPLAECETVMSMVYRQPLLPSDRDFIRRSECFSSFSNVRHVCCTSDTGFTGRQARRTKPMNSKAIATIAHTPSYTTPFNFGPHWETTVTRPLSNGAQRFIPRNDYETTQPQWPRFSNPDLVPEWRQGPSLPAFNDASRLPQPPTCGGVTIENKIYGGADARLREFPWMVILEYQRKPFKNAGNSLALSCGGSLINQRYVLTAAHCVHGTILKKIGPLVAIRLGEHDTSQKVDCNRFGSCTSEITRVGFEQIIPHELYTDSSTNMEHDIALIRLDRNIRYSDSISPVCLPSAVKGRSFGGFSPKPGTQLTVAGWGQTLQSPVSPVKQKLNVPLIDQKQCERKFRDARVNIVETQICAGGKFAQDSCGGDSGGPLMHFRGGVWVLEGIISFGYRCGLLGWPGVYTRVASFDDWIRSKLRA